MKSNRNTGRYKESTIVYRLDGSKVKDLDKDCRYIVRTIFGQLDDEEIIRSELIDGYKKPDFYIEYKGIRKNISLKTTDNAVVHEEESETFKDFLKEIGVSEKTLLDYLYLFWGDGTLDGTGERYFTFKTARFFCLEKCHSFNIEINGNHDFIHKIVDRALFAGRNSEGVEADYLLFYKEDEMPIIISRVQMRYYLASKEFSFLDGPHVGPLLIYSSQRAKDNPQNAFYRKRMGLWWPRFKSTLLYIQKYYPINERPKKKESANQTKI